ncbi:MAG: type I glutamate--ammonia ligase [Candidatus Paracaedibacteraceae bacterium]|nr:type I glutamate--ammonia ligase [Candidatus Paracaedibacteraceae bacterium]
MSNSKTDNAAKIQSILSFLEENCIQIVDIRFTDISGVWHHMSFPVSQVDKSLLKDGFCVDGSSIKGWSVINDSDLLVLPDVAKDNPIRMDPYSSIATAFLFADTRNVRDGSLYNRDPRNIARKAEQFLSQCGFANKAYFGPEAEFFVFDSVAYTSEMTRSFYYLESDEFPQQSAVIQPNNHGSRSAVKGGYFPVQPMDPLNDFRSDVVQALSLMGLVVERHHHEVAPAQHEIGFKYSTLVECADNLQIFKYGVRNSARMYDKTATFMPKPVFGDNGSGMHVHMSLWNDDTALFKGDAYAGLSDIALYAIGGVIKHAKSLNAFCNPTTNSYKRLVPGYEAPVICAYSASNRSAACRIPHVNSSNAKRFEARFPDPTANGYLCFSALLMAALDGIENKIHPGEAQVVDLFECKEIASKLPTVCGSLEEALVALTADHAYLLRGDVFDRDFIDTYIEQKKIEVEDIRLRPHPQEFVQYFNR